ncbi:LysR family transcriptional regulator [Microbacteriaceae bacterium K1510]|nr:LysR family transcriptional regulator [Microbacteriaceae bacterium K1510]
MLTQDIQRLQQFLSVVEHGSIGRGALALGISQPALSKSLKRLEEVVGVKLLERSRRGVVPTTFGQTLAAHARIIVAEVNYAEEELKALRGARSGRVRIGAGPSVIDQVLPAAIEAFCADQPHVRLTVNEGLVEQLLAALANTEIDIAIVSNSRGLDQEHFVCQPVLQDDLTVVCGAGHPLAARGRATLAELLDYRWVLPNRDEPVRQRFDDVFRAAGVPPPKAIVETSSVICMRSLARTGGFITWMPRLLAEHDERAGLLLPIAIDGVTWERQVYVCWRRTNSLLPACAKFIALLRESFHSAGSPTPAALTMAR